jgi:hypothetical protein
MTSDGIEPATFRFVAQNLKHCATAVPIPWMIGELICSNRRMVLDMGKPKYLFRRHVIHTVYRINREIQQLI